jgi:hypothetical protein
MANVQMTWSEILNKHVVEGLEFRYHEFSNRWQIYLLDGLDAYITYLPTQMILDSPTFVADDKVLLQTNLADWISNHKTSAIQTNGVDD